MCSRVRCNRCGKTTWSGCGSHVEQVMAGVPADRRCDCPPGPRRSLRDLLRRG